MYKNLSLAITIVLSFLMSSCAIATPELSCRDLSELANDLDELQADFDFGADIREGSVEDMMLGEVVSVVGMISEMEGDRSLRRAARGLENAYINMDDGAFSYNLGQIVDIIDRINIRDCY